MISKILVEGTVGVGLVGCILEHEPILLTILVVVVLTILVVVVLATYTIDNMMMVFRLTKGQ